MVRARAEELHGRREFSVVTSRAVAPLGRLLDWSMPLVRQGGALVAMKGSSAQEEVDAAAAELRRHGAGAVEVLTLGAGQIDPPTTVIRVEATRPSRLGWDAAERERGHDREARLADDGRDGAGDGLGIPPSPRRTTTASVVRAGLAGRPTPRLGPDGAARDGRSTDRYPQIPQSDPQSNGTRSAFRRRYPPMTAVDAPQRSCFT